MIDREKVINGLESCVISKTKCFFNKNEMCPYASVDVLHCEQELMRDALALLKEQKAIKRTSRKGTNGFSIVWTCGACGSDLYPNNAKAKYCSNCGQAVKWE